VWGECVRREGGRRELAHPRLTRHNHYLAGASLGLAPAPHEHFNFFPAPNQWSQRGATQRIEPGLNEWVGPQHLQYLDFSFDSPHVDRTKIAVVEEVPHKRPRCLVDQHTIRWCNRLQPSSPGRCFSDRGSFLTFPRADQITDNDKASGYCNPDLERLACI